MCSCSRQSTLSAHLGAERPLEQSTTTSHARRLSAGSIPTLNKQLVGETASSGARLAASRHGGQAIGRTNAVAWPPNQGTQL